MREKTAIRALYIATDAVLFYAILTAVSLARLSTLYQVDYVLLQRDRLVCIGLFLGAAMVVGAYRSGRMTDRFDAAYYVAGSVVATGVALLVLTALIPVDVRMISRRELVLGVVCAGVVLPVWRWFAAGFLARLRPLHRFVMVVGCAEEGRRIAQGINEGSRVIEAAYASVGDFELRMRERDGCDDPTDVVITPGPEEDSVLPDIIDMARRHGRRIYLHPTLHDIPLLSRMPLTAVAGIPLVEMADRERSGYGIIKRGMDLIFGLVALPVVLVVSIPVGIAIKGTSRGPVVYSQERMGKGGRKFRLYKFRSMVVDAEAATGPVWAQDNDARVTRVGRFLRRHRIDELPQVVNVLRGDMSLVGPRPERPALHAEFCGQLPLFERRLAVRPGLTSLSHILGSYSSEPGDRLRYDLVYIGSMSFLADVRILLGTIRIVLGGKGAL